MVKFELKQGKFGMYFTRNGEPMPLKEVLEILNKQNKQIQKDSDGVSLFDKITVIEQCINTITSMRYRKGEELTVTDIVSEFINECEYLKKDVNKNE